MIPKVSGTEETFLVLQIIPPSVLSHVDSDIRQLDIRALSKTLVRVHHQTGL